MPSNVVNIDLQTATGGAPRDTYSDLVLIGDSPDVADPTENEPIAYNSADDVSTDFGSDADVTTAAQAVDSKGAEAWWVIMAGADTNTNELIDGSDSSSVQTGTLQNTPVKGGVDDVTVTLDGSDQTVVPTVESPPQTPASGEAALNFDTGELELGDTTSGSGDGIEVTYDTLQWDAIKNKMEDHDLDLATLADVRADESYIGDYDELITFAEANEMAVVLAYDDAGNYTDQQAAMDAYHTIGSYLPSKAVLPIGHFSSGQVGAEQAGRLAVKPPWFDPFWDAGANYSFTSEYFRKAMLGEPGDPNTLEGGDSNEEGPVNVIKTVAGTKVLSNSVTTAGTGSNYQYFDVYRTETFVAEEVEKALTQMRLRNEQVPFAPNGRTLIRDALRSRLRQYITTGDIETRQVQSVQTGSGGENDTETQEVRAQTATGNVGAPLSSVTIDIPRHNELADTDKQNRVWSGIRIEGVLASNAHTFSVTLDVQM